MAAKYSAVIAAGGQATRFGNPGLLKEKLGGKSILSHSLDLFEADGECGAIILVANKVLRDWVASDPLTFSSGKLKLVEAGATRLLSLRAGVAAAPEGVVLVHDGNRPNFTDGLVKRLLATVAPGQGAVPAVAVRDAVGRLEAVATKGGGAKGNVFGPSADHRTGVLAGESQMGRHAIQTPQAFDRAELLHALDKANASDGDVDLADLYRDAGFSVAAVEGLLGNLRVTTEPEYNLLYKLMGGPPKKKDKYGGLGW